MKYEVLIDGHAYQVSIDRTDRGPQQAGSWLDGVAAQGYSCTVDGDPFELDVAPAAREVLSIIHQGRSYEARREISPAGETHILIGARRFRAELRDPRSLRSRRASLDAKAGPVGIHAPMPGKVIRLLAAAGDEVEAGQGLLVVEAMKMQNEIRSTKKGKLAKIAVQEASAVNAGDLLAIVE